MADLFDDDEDQGGSNLGDSSLGGLAALSQAQKPDLLTAIALLDNKNFGPSTQQANPTTNLLDTFRARYMGILPPQGALQEALQQVRQRQADPNLKWMQFAAGMLSPTKTGALGESLGYGLQGLAKGTADEQKIRQGLAQQNFGDILGMEKMGMEGARIDATLQALQQRMAMPSPEAKMAMSRADLSGHPRNTPEWNAAFQDEMKKMQFLKILNPDEKAHLATLAGGDPTSLPLQKLVEATSAYRSKIERRADVAADLKTNPLHAYGVDNFDDFMKNTASLSGDELMEALPPMLKADVKGLLGGNITMPSISGRSNANAANLLLGIAQRVDPDFSTARNKMMNEYKVPKSGNVAFNINAINTAIGHIGTLDTLGDALKNNDIQGANKVLNSVLSQFGKPQQNNYELAQQAVAEELMRVFRQVGASEREATAWGQKFSSANSPEKIHDAARNAVELLKSRVDALNEPWKREFHNDFPMLTDKSKGIVEGLETRAHKGLAPMVNVKGWKLHVDKDGNKAYVSPDGKSFEEVK